MKMTKVMKTVLGMGLAAAILVGCTSNSSSTASSDAKHIGILQYVEHESLTASREGFVNELEKEGYKDGDNIIIDYQNAQGDQANLQSISESLLQDNEVVLGIATPAAQSLVNLASDQAILFTAVTDPISAKLIDTMEQPNGLATGTSDMSPIDKQVELLQKVMPDVKKVGIMYTTSERNSEVQVDEAKKAFKKAGIETVVKGISSTNDVQDTAKNLFDQAEVLFVPTDNTVASSVTLLTELSKEVKKPVVGGSADMVPAGVLFSYGADYEALGRQTAKQAIKILEGEKAADVAAEYPEALSVVVNDDMAKELGIDISSIKEK